MSYDVIFEVIVGQSDLSAIVLRRSENWSELPTTASYISRATHSLGYLRNDNPVDYYRMMCNLYKWDAKMRMSLPAYRAKLAERSSSSWGNTNMPVVRQGETSMFRWVVPTDDDDIFHPDLRACLDNAVKEGEPRIIHWDCWFYFPCTAHTCYYNATFGKVSIEAWKWLGSNAYAVSGNEGWELMINHCEATRLLQSGVKSVYIDRALSVWVRHPASMYSLCVSDLDKLPMKMCEEKCPKEIEWAMDDLLAIEQATIDLIGRPSRTHDGIEE